MTAGNERRTGEWEQATTESTAPQRLIPVPDGITVHWLLEATEGNGNHET